jgi:hypothetical protein
MEEYDAARGHRWKCNSAQERCALIAGKLGQESGHNTRSVFNTYFVLGTFVQRNEFLSLSLSHRERLVASSCPSISAASTERISLKFGIGDVYISLVI